MESKKNQCSSDKYRCTPKGGNMLKAIRMAMRYGHLMDDIVAFIELCRTTGKDGKLSKTERGQLISASSKLIKTIRNS